MIGSDRSTGAATVVADLASLSPGGGPGAVWSLPHGGDLDANVVRLDPGGVIDTHVNDAVDVLIVVRSGGADLFVDDAEHPVHPDVLVLIPRGARRRIVAGPTGVCYLSVHRQRGPLTISSRSGRGR